MVGVEYTMVNEHLSTNVHMMTFNSDYDFMGGIGVAYRFKGLTGPFAFHSSEWISGEMESFEIKYKDGDSSELIEHKRNINYWRLVFGLGYLKILMFCGWCCT